MRRSAVTVYFLGKFVDNSGRQSDKASKRRCDRWSSIGIHLTGSRSKVWAGAKGPVPSDCYARAGTATTECDADWTISTETEQKSKGNVVFRSLISRLDKSDTRERGLASENAELGVTERERECCVSACRFLCMNTYYYENVTVALFVDCLLPKVVYSFVLMLFELF